MMGTPFKFLNMWLMDKNCLPSIKSRWQLPARQSGLKKLFRLKQHLKWWNKHCFGNIFTKLKEVETEVAGADENLHNSPTSQNLVSFNAASEKFSKALDMEESFWKQKASCGCHLEGDRNTKLFHNLVQRRRNKASIMSIYEEGNIISSPLEISKSALVYFEKIFSDPILISGVPSFENIPALVTNDMNLYLRKLPDLE